MAYLLQITVNFLPAVTQGIVLKEIIDSGILGFEVVTEEVMRIIFWEMTQCSQLKINRRFGGIYVLHFKVNE
jgi:hypothetical protein